MPSANLQRIARHCFFIVAFALSLGIGVGPAAAESDVLVWAPASIDADRLSATTRLYYDGLAGRLVGAPEEAGPALTTLGGTVLPALAGRTLWVYLVENGATAVFESPAEPLLRLQHEVLIAMPGGDPPHMTEASEAAQAGLKQVRQLRLQPLPWSDTTEGGPPPVLDVDPLVQQLVNDVTQAELVATWQALDDFENRYTFATQNNTATQWMYDQFAAMGLDVQFDYYTQSGQQRRNVVATHPGLVDPTKVVYLCGHLDATSENTNVCAPGADDNGSGTAAVIEAARAMSAQFFQYTIKFALFNGEEQGLLGSAAYVAEIAAAGEDVVCAFNMDMIAYRGTDPAPPDLVIYTNTGSQPFANAIQDAINTYLPGQLTPVIRVEALSGSDHASFWDHSYKAVCAIEDEAWGDDFCPWYHTCNDRIERYPQDYILACARATIAAAAATALPLSPQGSFFVVSGTDLDDDTTGGTSGNNDDVPNPGEVIDLRVTLHNVGQGNATGITGVLSCTNPDVEILQANSSWNNIPSGGSGANLTPFRFRVTGGVSDEEFLQFNLAVNDNNGLHDVNFVLQAAAPVLTYQSHGIDDQTLGNGNGVPDPGEVLLVPVSLVNNGSQDAANVVGTLSSLGGHVSVIDAQGGNPLIASGAVGALTPAFRIAVSSSAVDGEDLPLRVQLTAGFGYAAQTEFTLRVGSYFFDNAEAVGGWRFADGDDTATSGLWTQDDPIGTTYNGSQAQSEDDHTPTPGVRCFFTGQGSPGGAAGEADVDGGKTTLTSPTLDLSHVTQPRVTYWRWYTNNLGNNPNQDTWLVQITNDGGGTWVDLERTTDSANSWQQRSFLVSDYVTPTAQVAVRFVASDVSPGTLVEAAVDDFEIEGVFSPVDAPDASVVSNLRLDPVRPNPVTGSAIIGFALPAAASVSVRVHAVDGRTVATLHDAVASAGFHHLEWDGDGDGHRRLAPGVYYVTMRTGEREITRPVTIAR